MTLPPILLFARDWDPTPIDALHQLLNPLANLGYDTLCTEAPEDYSEDTQISMREKNFTPIDETLAFLKKMHPNSKREIENLPKHPLLEIQKKLVLLNPLVPEQSAEELAYGMKDYLTARPWITTLKKAQKLSFTIHGVDLKKEEYTKIADLDRSRWDMELKKQDLTRMIEIPKKITSLSKSRKGLVICLHPFFANQIIKNLNQTLSKKPLIYFAHSGESHFNGVNEIKTTLKKNKELLNRAFPLKEKKDTDSFIKTVLEEVRKNTKYAKEMDDPHNMLKKHLLKFFGIDEILLFLTPGYVMDAFIDMENPKIPSIKQALEEKKIPTSKKTFKKKAFLVIRGVNTPEFAKKSGI